MNGIHRYRDDRRGQILCGSTEARASGGRSCRTRALGYPCPAGHGCRLVEVGALLAVLHALTAPAAEGMTPFLGASPAADSVRTAQAIRIEAEIAIDGRLNEASWRAAPVADGFRQHNVNPGQPASQPTEVRIGYDDRNLYVAMRMFDVDPGRIAAQLGRRGATDLYSDWAHVLIDSYRDRRTAFVFSLTPRSVQRDGRMFVDIGLDYSWDAVWEGAARIDSLGWTAEFLIPLSQLRFSLTEDGETVWGINFGREIARVGELSYWAHIPPEDGRFVSRFGRLLGVREIPEPRRLELAPYILARASRIRDDPVNPFHASLEPEAEVGLDARYGLGPNLTLTATFNPEFGQVDADPAVVNLSAFETFYPERRPFFVEGADIFRWGIGALLNPSETLFYSRRIGRAPQGSVPADAVHADVPGATRILGAGKLSGKTSSGWSLGVLHALTGRADRYTNPRTVGVTRSR